MGHEFLLGLAIDDDIKVTKLGHRIAIWNEAFTHMGCAAGFDMPNKSGGYPRQTVIIKYAGGW